MNLDSATSVDPALHSLDVLSQYEQIWRQSRRMKEAAGEGDWDSLIDLERARAAISKTLIPQARRCSLSPEDQAILAGMIRNILASDEDTKSLIAPRQQELKTTFGIIDTEKKLLKAYAII